MTRQLIGKRNVERAADMIAAGVITEDKSCRGKVRHPDKKAAIHAAKQTARMKDRKASYYRCGFCSGYHVTLLRHGEDVEE